MNSKNEPSEEISRKACVRNCSQNFPKYNLNYGSRIRLCKKICDTDEAYTIDEPNMCKKLADINTNI